MNAPIPLSATSTLAAMKAARRWLLRTRSKQPFYADNTPRRGELDGQEDISRLVTYAEAVAALDRVRRTNPEVVGLGFALGPDGRGGSWQGIDLDHVSARRELQDLRPELRGYVEVSIGGDGLHAIGYGVAFTNASNNGVEAYSSGRYFTFSGDVIRDDPPTDQSAFVMTCLQPWLRAPKTAGTLAATQEGVDTLPVQDHVIDDLRSALEHLKSEASDYHAWVAVGQALADPNLCGAGKELWMEWSAADPRFAPDESERKWATFKPDRTGYAAIFAKAQALGWENPRAGLPSATNREQQGERFKVIPLANLGEVQPPAPSFWIQDYVPARVVTLLGAHGGAGKTMLGLVAAACIATGRPFMGKQTKRARVLFLSGEDDMTTVQWRMAQICREYGIDPAALDGWLTAIDATEDDPTLYIESIVNGTRIGIPTDGYKQLRSFVEDGHDVLIIDNASDVYGADENSRPQVRGFMRALAKLVKGRSGAIILLAHVDKNTARSNSGTEGYSGSTAWHNSARSRLFLKADETGGLILEHQKSNFGKRAEPINLCWSPHAVLTVNGSAASVAGADTDERDKVLQLVLEFYQRGENISPFPHSPANAWKALHGEEGFPKRLTRTRLFDLLRNMQRAGLLDIEQYRNSSRHISQRWRVTERGQSLIEIAALF